MYMYIYTYIAVRPFRVAMRCSAYCLCFSVLQYTPSFVLKYSRVLQCVAVRCSVLQCVAVCCSALQYVAVRCSAYFLCFSVLQYTPSFVLKYSRVLQCVAVHCSALQWVAVRYSVLQRIAIRTFQYANITSRVFVPPPPPTPQLRTALREKKEGGGGGRGERGGRRRGNVGGGWGEGAPA